MTVKPLDNRLLIRVHKRGEFDELGEGGLFVPSAKTTFTYGEVNKPLPQKTVGQVEALGPGERMDNGRRRPIEAKIGDWVAFSDSCGRPVDEDHILIREDDIMFFMEQPTKVDVLDGRP